MATVNFQTANQVNIVEHLNGDIVQHSNPEFNPSEFIDKVKEKALFARPEKKEEIEKIFDHDLFSSFSDKSTYERLKEYSTPIYDVLKSYGLPAIKVAALAYPPLAIIAEAANFIVE